MEAYTGFSEQKDQDYKAFGQMASIVASYSSQFLTKAKKQIPPEDIMPWAWNVKSEAAPKTKEELKAEHERVKNLLNVK